MSVGEPSVGVAAVSPSGWSSNGVANFDVVQRHLESAPRVDLVVLPELVGGEAAAPRYERLVSRLARDTGAWVVGGSHHHRTKAATHNRGLVADPAGTTVAEYDKRYPFDSEFRAGIKGGRGPSTFATPWGTAGVAICADLFHSETVAELDVDLLAVPCFSVSAPGRLDVAVDVWRHLAVARSYELGTYLVVCDWAPNSRYDELMAAGVTCSVDPTAVTPTAPLAAGGRGLSVWSLVLGRLALLHARRSERGFLVRDRLRQPAS